MKKPASAPDVLSQIILVACLTSVVVSFFVLGGFWAYDVRVWYLSGQDAFEHGLLSVYSLQAQAPTEFPGGYFDYPIPWLAWDYAAYALKQALALNLDQWLYLVKLPCLLFLLATMLLLHFWVRNKSGDRKAALAVFAFSVFPGFANVVFGPIIGYFDPIPVFFTVLALVLFERKQLDFAALALGFGAAFKYYPLLLLPVFLLSLNRKNGLNALLRFAVICIAPLLLVSIPPLLYDPWAYLRAHIFYSEWAGSTSLYKLLYGAMGWDVHLWFGKTIPPGTDLTLLPFVSAAAMLILISALLAAYATIYKRRVPLIQGILLVLLAVLGFWRFAEHNHAMWAFPFAAAVLFFSPKLRAPAFAWMLTVFLMSLSYILIMPDWLALASAMLVPLASIACYGAILTEKRKRI